MASEQGTINVPIHRSEAIRFHEGVASAEINGEEFRYSQAVGDGTLMFWIGDRQYEITTQDLCAAVVEHDSRRPPESEGESVANTVVWVEEEKGDE